MLGTEKDNALKANGDNEGQDKEELAKKFKSTMWSFKKQIEEIGGEGDFIKSLLKLDYADMVVYNKEEDDVDTTQMCNHIDDRNVKQCVDEKAFVRACSKQEFQLAIGKEVLSVDPTYFRPTEVDLLIGDPSKAKNKLGWVPEHDLASLVKDMMQSDIDLMKKDVTLLSAGHEILKQAE